MRSLAIASALGCISNIIQYQKILASSAVFTVCGHRICTHVQTYRRFHPDEIQLYLSTLIGLIIILCIAQTEKNTPVLLHDSGIMP